MDLVALDMNGVLTERCLAYVLSERHARQGMRYWELYRQGELDTADFVHIVGRTHKGLPCSLIEEEARAIPTAEHSPELMRALTEGGFEFVIASADYGNLVRWTASALGPYQPALSFGNEAVFVDSAHSGKIQTPIVDGMQKARRVDAFKASRGPSRLISVGDDRTCRELFCISDVTVAYNSRDDELRRHATYCIDGGSLLDLAEIFGRI